LLLLQESKASISTIEVFHRLIGFRENLKERNMVKIFEIRSFKKFYLLIAF